MPKSCAKFHPNRTACFRDAIWPQPFKNPVLSIISDSSIILQHLGFVRKQLKINVAERYHLQTTQATSSIYKEKDIFLDSCVVCVVCLCVYICVSMCLFGCLCACLCVCVCVSVRIYNPYCLPSCPSLRQLKTALGGEETPPVLWSLVEKIFRLDWARPWVCVFSSVFHIYGGVGGRR